MFTLLSGETIARELLRGLKKKAERKRLSLMVIQVGKNAISEKYIAEKQKAAALLGVGFKVVQLSASVSQAELEEKIGALAKDPKVTGMIVQLPLPKHLKTQQALDCIPLHKDVDVLSSASFGKFALGQLNVLPPTVGAIALLLRKTGVNLQGAKVTVVGAGRLVGLPLIFWLLKQEATVSVANKYTKNLSALTREADIIVSGVGKTGLIQGAMVKKGATVIDAGTSVEAGHTKGDIDFQSVSKKAKFISPVPGGVGPLTVACLFQNLVFLTKH